MTVVPGTIGVRALFTALNLSQGNKMEPVKGPLEKGLTIGLVVLAIAVIAFLGAQHIKITADAIGTACVEVSEADAESLALEFVKRKRTDQQLHIDYDLREEVGAPAPKCATVLGESRCNVTGPAYLSGTLQRWQVVYQIPAGKTAIVRANASGLFCVIPDA